MDGVTITINRRARPSPPLKIRTTCYIATGVQIVLGGVVYNCFRYGFEVTIYEGIGNVFIGLQTALL
jgi:tetrahydrodipicolinate N-succinyltransferase